MFSFLFQEILFLVQEIFFLSFFFFAHTAGGILVPQTSIEPVPPALAAPTFNHWTTGA